MSLNTQKSSNVSYGLRELSDSEFYHTCGLVDSYNYSNNSSIRELANSTLGSSFTVPISTRVYRTGCYYLNTSGAEWSTEGLSDSFYTNITQSRCRSNHLTLPDSFNLYQGFHGYGSDFAAGFSVLEISLDFNYVFTHADFYRNPTIYLTVIIVSSAYVVLLVLFRFMDMRDKHKTNLNVLSDNDFDDDYFYEITFFTGSRMNSGTESKVKLLTIPFFLWCNSDLNILL